MAEEELLAEEVELLAQINEILFTTVPGLAFLCNIFLLFTLLTAKKDSSIYAFMGLLFAFALWTGGSFCMRAGMYPGVIFWWKVSVTGIFLVPYLYFLLASAYTEQKGFFLKIVWGIGTLVMIILNLCNVFLYNPHMEMVDGDEVFHYSVRVWALIPIIFAVLVLITVWRVIARSIRVDEMPVKYVRPLMLGVLIMLAGVLLDMIPALNTLPNDTFACAVNAALIYYAFYKKRIYALSQITSKGAVYIISLIITGCALGPLCEAAKEFFTGYFGNLSVDPVILIAVVSSGAAIALFLLLNRLCQGLFIKEQNRKDDRIHNFSVAVNSSLKLDEIQGLFYQLVKEEISAEHIYLSMYSREEGKFVSCESSDSLERIVEISPDNPVLKKLETADRGIFYADFKKSTAYRAMWEEEKRQLEMLDAAYIVPFKNGSEILGITVFSEKIGKRPYTYEEINFIESVVSVADIAIKNAQLYQRMEKEARLDLLTGVLNRRALIHEMEEKFRDSSIKPITLILFNMDDFSLYNELYGSEEGDCMLKRFAGILKMVFGSRGIIARYGGKEFAVLLPFCDALTAKTLAENVQSELAARIEKSHETTKKFLTFSAGICTYPHVAVSMNQLVSYANMAVFQVKQNGKNQISIYNANKEPEESLLYKTGHMNELSSTIYALTAAIDAKDHYTFNHSQCVSLYATKLAELAGLSKEHVEIIRQAGLLHDIGKIGIPDAILTKQGRLTNEEFSIMRQHVERSIEMIRHLPSLDYVIPAVIGHHERYDGKGYPRGIGGEDIPIGARCLSVADSFDAMISKRSYKDKIPVEDALREIKENAGKQFDPKLSEIFVNAITSGEIEVVGY